MTQWTESARRCFADYCERARQSLDGGEVDINEVLDDLRRHVDEEVRLAGLTVVNEEDLRKLLARIGDPELLQRKPSPTPPAQPGRPDWKKPGFLLLFPCVILPVIALGFEYFTQFSAAILFDPIPTWFHIALIALVPTANLLLWRAARQGSDQHAPLLGWLNGAAIGISLFYAVLYLPFTPFAAIAIVYFGVGLIPLSALLASLATPWLRRRYRQSLQPRTLSGLWGGMLAAITLLAALQIQNFCTYRGLFQAVSDESGISRSGVELLRTVGDEEMVLRACYGQFGRGGPSFMDPIRWLASGGRNINAEDARTVYYRVTGRPFNAVPPPTLRTRGGRWNALEEEFSWDNALGGDAVAGRVKGLSLASSRLDAIAEPEAALVYCEWTLEFKNASSQPREARAQIALPPGGVVSRLTLWVDGEEREAAFAGRSAVKEAYRQVAIVQRRDPVLVTTCGPDRVLMQCFPVPANGGVMKVRLGITAPLRLETLDRGRFVWPRCLERNFGLSATFKHTLWLESPNQLEGSDGLVSQATNRFHWRATVTEPELANVLKPAVVSRPAPATEVWFPAQAAGQYILQTISPTSPTPPTRIVLVMDGSVGMAAFAPQLAEALTGLNEGVELSVIVAGDEPQWLTAKPVKATASPLAEVSAGLKRFHCVGGQNNLPALERAWDLAAESDRGVVLWVHAPQPVLLGSADSLRQRLDRSGGKVAVYEYQVATGPDRLVEKLDGLPAVQHVVRMDGLKTDLANLLGSWFGKANQYAFTRTSVNTQPASGVRAASRQIERLWAADEVRRRMAARDYASAIELAGKQQLVTPCSGAVVLETKAQYERNNLTPADPTTVPAIPEPETWALVLTGLLLAFVGRHRRP